MKLRRLIALSAVLTLSLGVLSACGGSDSSSAAGDPASSSAEPSSQNETPSPELSNRAALAVTDEALDAEALNKAITSLGDTTKLQAKMKKALAGEKVTVAYLGGSITEGYSAGAEKCYAKLSFEKFKAAFGKDGGSNVEYVNAGISGTPSMLGNLRLQRDILSHDPDIVFIEFAVNDARDSDHKAAYESIVRDLLEKDIAVVLLFSRMESGYSAQDYMKEIGAYYSVPMVSYADGVTYMLDNKKIEWKQFSGDYTHPNFRGHAIVADMIGYFFEKVWDDTPKVAEYPEKPLSAMIQQGMQMFENGDIEPESMGSWKKGSQAAFFNNGWTHEAGSNEPLVFKMKGKFLHLVYKVNKVGNLGDIKVKVTTDGADTSEKTIKTLTDDGWGNPLIEILARKPAEHEYTVEISMADGNEDKTAEILAIAHN